MNKGLANLDVSERFRAKVENEFLESVNNRLRALRTMAGDAPVYNILSGHS